MKTSLVPFVFSALLLVSTLSSCYQVPETGRHALNLMKDEDVAKVSMAAFDHMKTTKRVSTDRAARDRLVRVGERLQNTISFWDMPDADWEFVLFENPQINAFAMGGGKVGVYTGLMKIIETDDQLAAVMAHEIAHVTAKHMNEKLSEMLLIQTGGIVGSVAMMGNGASFLTQEAVLSAYGLGTGVGGLVFSREKEMEADHIGLMYMARAGYNPEAAIEMFEKLEMATADKPRPSEWLSTHPATPDRIEAIRAALPAAEKLREQSTVKAQPSVVK